MDDKNGSVWIDNVDDLDVSPAGRLSPDQIFVIVNVTRERPLGMVDRIFHIDWVNPVLLALADVPGVPPIDIMISINALPPQPPAAMEAFRESEVQRLDALALLATHQLRWRHFGNPWFNSLFGSIKTARTPPCDGVYGLQTAKLPNPPRHKR